jgi:SAM-dependent methyltransferase
VAYWAPSDDYRKVVEANRRFYERFAGLYESTETHLNDPRAQRMLESDLDAILQAIGRPPDKVRALDACGGSGTVAVKLLDRGVDVTVCDVSEELLAYCKATCADHGLEPTIVCGDVGEFLATTTDTWDLIVFSSALHHLENIRLVLRLSLDRLAPGGLLFTVFDPTSRRGGLAGALIFLDYLIFRLHRRRGELPASVARRLRRTVDRLGRQSPAESTVPELTEANLGILTEYHVERGIDDIGLANDLADIGFEVVGHERYVSARFALTRRLLSLLHEVTAFKLLLRRPEVEPSRASDTTS